MLGKTKKIIVYIDGFNLYHGLLRKKSKGLRWLDLEKLSNKIKTPGDQLAQVKYFTAKVNGKYDKDKPARQEVYWRALRANKKIKIIEGNFIEKDRTIQINQDTSIRGKVPEEKGSDVNLAVHLVRDALKSEFDRAIVLTNDSDLAEAINIVIKDTKKDIKIIAPNRTIAKKLSKLKCPCATLKLKKIEESQFPNTIKDKKGNELTKPSKW